MAPRSRSTARFLFASSNRASPAAMPPLRLHAAPGEYKTVSSRFRSSCRPLATAKRRRRALRLEACIEELKGVERQPALGTPKGTPAPFQGMRRHSRNCTPLNGKIVRRYAKVAELADAPDLGSGPARGGSSSLPFRTHRLECIPREPARYWILSLVGPTEEEKTRLTGHCSISSEPKAQQFKSERPC